MLMITILSAILIWLIVFTETKAFINDVMILIMLAFGINAYLFFY